MANTESDIVKIINSPDSLRGATTVIRGSVVQTVCDCRRFNAADAIIQHALAIGDYILLCPVNLHDRLSNISFYFSAATVNTTVLQLWLLQRNAAGEINPPAVAGSEIANLGADMAAAALAVGGIRYPFVPAFGNKNTPVSTGNSFYSFLTPAQRGLLSEKTKKTGELLLGLKATTVGGVTGMIAFVDLVKSGPSAISVNHAV